MTAIVTLTASMEWTVIEPPVDADNFLNCLSFDCTPRKPINYSIMSSTDKDFADDDGNAVLFFIEFFIIIEFPL